MLHENQKKSNRLNKGSIPRRKRLKRKNRLVSARKWIPTYSGSNIVKGYANWFGVDLLCSIKELKMNDVIIDSEYEKQVIKSIETKIKDQQKEYNSPSQVNFYDESENSDQNFAFIAGYTSGGAPFGITHEEDLNPEHENFTDNI